MAPYSYEMCGRHEEEARYMLHELGQCVRCRRESRDRIESGFTVETGIETNQVMQKRHRDWEEIYNG
jgi:hypothetical protein